MALSVLLGAVWLLASPPDYPRVTLLYERTGDARACPDEADLRSLVTMRLGYDPFVDAAPLAITVRFFGDEGGVRGDMLAQKDGAAAGGRTFDGEQDCQALAQSLALALSLAIDPMHMLARKPDSPVMDPQERPPEPPAEAAMPVTEEPLEVPRSSGPNLGGAIGILGAWGSAPKPTAGGMVGLGVYHESWEVSLEGRVDLPTRVRDGSGSVNASLLIASLVPCGRLKFFAGCLVISGGALRGEGEGFRGARRVFTPYADVGARVQAMWQSHFGPTFFAYTELRGALIQTSLTVSERTVWRLPPLHAALGLGARLHFL